MIRRLSTTLLYSGAAGGCSQAPRRLASTGHDNTTGDISIAESLLIQQTPHANASCATQRKGRARKTEGVKTERQLQKQAEHEERRRQKELKLVERRRAKEIKQEEALKKKRERAAEKMLRKAEAEKRKCARKAQVESRRAETRTLQLQSFVDRFWTTFRRRYAVPGERDRMLVMDTEAAKIGDQRRNVEVLRMTVPVRSSLRHPPTFDGSPPEQQPEQQPHGGARSQVGRQLCSFTIEREVTVHEGAIKSISFWRGDRTGSIMDDKWQVHYFPLSAADIGEISFRGMVGQRVKFKVEHLRAVFDDRQDGVENREACGDDITMTGSGISHDDFRSMLHQLDVDSSSGQNFLESDSAAVDKTSDAEESLSTSENTPGERVGADKQKGRESKFKKQGVDPFGRGMTTTCVILVASGAHRMLWRPITDWRLTSPNMWIREYGYLPWMNSFVDIHGRPRADTTPANHVLVQTYLRRALDRVDDHFRFHSSLRAAFTVACCEETVLPVRDRLAEVAALDTIQLPRGVGIGRSSIRGLLGVVGESADLTKPAVKETVPAVGSDKAPFPGFLQSVAVREGLKEIATVDDHKAHVRAAQQLTKSHLPDVVFELVGQARSGALYDRTVHIAVSHRKSQLATDATIDCVTFQRVIEWLFAVGYILKRPSRFLSNAVGSVPCVRTLCVLPRNITAAVETANRAANEIGGDGPTVALGNRSLASLATPGDKVHQVAFYWAPYDCYRPFVLYHSCGPASKRLLVRAARRHNLNVNELGEVTRVEEVTDGTTSKSPVRTSQLVNFENEDELLQAVGLGNQVALDRVV